MRVIGMILIAWGIAGAGVAATSMSNGWPFIGPLVVAGIGLVLLTASSMRKASGRGWRRARRSR